MIEKSVTLDIGHRESIFRKPEAQGDLSDGSPLQTCGDDGERHVTPDKCYPDSLPNTVMPDIRHRASIGSSSFWMDPR
jgi:hypothetical protein